MSTYEYLPILLTSANTTAITITTARMAPITIPTICPELRPSAKETFHLHFFIFRLFVLITVNPFASSPSVLSSMFTSSPVL